MCDAGQHRRVLDQKRKISAAAADRLEQREQARENLLRMACLRGDTKELRQERIEALARCRGQLEISGAGANSRQLREQRWRVGEARVFEQRAMQGAVGRIAPQRRKRVLFHIVGVAEQRVEVTIDGVAVAIERRGQGICVEQSACLRQRKFRLGYPRAARMIEIFELEGVVGPANGSKPRQVQVRDYTEK